MQMKEPKRKHIFIFFFIVILLLLIVINSISQKKNSESPQENSAAEGNTATIAENLTEERITLEESEPDISQITAQDFVSDITVGWNLGNSLDSCVNDGQNDGTHDPAYYETAWGNPVTTPELINLVAASGFNTIRIPVTWYYNTYEQDGHLYIREEWLKRVAEIVDYAYANNMYVIINSHHDAPIIWADMNDIEQVAHNTIDLWAQIADYFKDYDYKLIFEGFNEINTKDNSWIYSDSASQATNILNQVFVDTIRASGGNNANRLLICNTYLSDTTEEVLNSFVLPTDSVNDKLIIEVHSYDSSYNQEINDLFSQLNTFSERQKAPVIIGEFGSTNSFVPSEFRTNHAGNYIARANDFGIKCIWWDDGSSYKLIDRTTNTLINEDILLALMHPERFKTKILNTFFFQSMDDYTYGMINAENGNVESYSQGALTLNPNGTGISVMQDLGYRITLTNKNDADGMRLFGISFYNSEHEFLSYINIDAQTVYDVTAPPNASYMKIWFYNPWGYRSINDYQTYIRKQYLFLKISAYRK